jgi:Flp pilus assembly pilin Flp
MGCGLIETIIDENMLKTIKKFLIGNDGVSSVEYAILLAAIAVAIIAAIVILRNEIVTSFNSTATDMSNARSQ